MISKGLHVKYKVVPTQSFPEKNKPAYTPPEVVSNGENKALAEKKSRRQKNAVNPKPNE
jgi:hypothetical protein